MRTLATRITANDEIGSIQQLLNNPLDQSLLPPTLTGFRTSSAASRIVLSALWALKPRSLLTGQPYDRQQLIEAIQPDATLAGVAKRILSREPENRRAWAANRILVLEAEDELPKSVADLLIAPPLGRDVAEHDLFASHALDAKLVRALTEEDKTAFLDGRQQRIKQMVADFIERMAETRLEDTPPLDSFNLDDMEAERDDALI